MGQQQKIELSLKGIYTSPNVLSGAPQGALEIGENVILKSKNLIESRRGQTQYGDPVTLSSGQINKLFNYSSNLIINYENKLAYDSGSGIWVDYTGTYNPPSSDYKMRSLEAQKNFYLTTSLGIYKLDAINGTPKAAGVVRALGGTVTLSGSSGFLVDNSAVAYRIVWGYTDANENLILGAPSERIIATNSTGGSRNVQLSFLIPSTITTDYFYQIYRSFGTLSSSDTPSDELQLVAQGNPTSGEISAKTFTVIDITPYSLMRATLYTSPSQEGIINENTPPPFAIDMDIYKNSAFFGNIRQKQTLNLALISAGTPSFGFYTDGSVGTTNGSASLSTIADTTALRVGMKAVGTGIPANSLILSIDTSTTVTISHNATATASVSVEFQDLFYIGGQSYWAASSSDVTKLQFKVDTSGTPGQNISNTAKNLIQILNTNPSNSTIYAYYISGIEDLPGQILFEERGIGGVEFFARSSSGSSFSPVLSLTGDTIISSNEERQNRVIVSKPGQIEAVPAYQYFDVGSANFPINKVVALRDGIFFFKDDGIYRLSGETFSSFVVTLIDNTVLLKVPESAVAFNNQIFCFTTQGICAVTDSGVRIMSIAVEDTLLQISSDQYTNFAKASFGVGYESARIYLFFTVSETDDTYATQCYCYNSLTDAWTHWPLSRTCGIVNPSVDKLFMGNPSDGQVLIERKTFTNADFADEEYPVEIDSVDSFTEVTLVDASLVVVGMTLQQGLRSGLIQAIDGDILTITATKGLMPGDATVFTPILNKVKWLPIDAENPGILKQFSEVALFFKNAAFRSLRVEFNSNISPSVESLDLANNSIAGQWGYLNFGQFPWGGVLGGNAALRTYVLREKQRSHWLGLLISTNEAFTGFSLQGVSIVYNPMSTRFR